MSKRLPHVLLTLALVLGELSVCASLASIGPGKRTNTTAHLVFGTVSSLLQHWPNTIYRNGHTFVPATIPSGTILQHGRSNRAATSSPEYFAFDVDHAYLFCLSSPCLMLTYATRRNLYLGYFDGTSASVLEGPRDLQDILFNENFTPPLEYDAWDHAKAACAWAKELSLDGIIRMEQSFEVILCDTKTSLTLVVKRELVYPESLVVARNLQHSHQRLHSDNKILLHPGLANQSPTFPEPVIPALPAPPAWKGKQPAHLDMAFEAIRAGMWHNHAPGEARVQLDYSGVVSAYDESFSSLAESRRGVPRSRHRLDGISYKDRERFRAEVRDIAKRGHRKSGINWASLFQVVLDRHADRLEDLGYILRRHNVDPIEAVASARHKILVMLSPYMVLPQAKSHNPSSSNQTVPDSDWFEHIYQACASHATSGILDRGALTKQELLLASSIDGVQGEICARLTSMWMSAFDSEERPVFAERIVAEWNREVKELMEWLDWPMWVKCDPPCGLGLVCTLATWPWEIVTGDENLGPTCRDKMLDI